MFEILKHLCLVNYLNHFINIDPLYAFVQVLCFMHWVREIYIGCLNILFNFDLVDSK